MGPERRIEAASCVYAKRQGCWALKLFPTITGLPDRLFLLPRGQVWFVEFKAPNGRLSARQRVVIKALAKLGFPVTVCNDTNKFKEMLDKLLRIP